MSSKWWVPGNLQLLGQEVALENPLHLGRVRRRQGRRGDVSARSSPHWSRSASVVRAPLPSRPWLAAAENARAPGSTVGSVRCGPRRLQEAPPDPEGILKLAKGLEGLEGGVSSTPRGPLRKQPKAYRQQVGTSESWKQGWGPGQQGLSAPIPTAVRPAPGYWLSVWASG